LLREEGKGDTKVVKKKEVRGMGDKEIMESRRRKCGRMSI
jgi:hypothetical protein